MTFLDIFNFQYTYGKRIILKFISAHLKSIISTNLMFVIFLTHTFLFSTVDSYFFCFLLKTVNFLFTCTSHAVRGH